jgi:DNA-binding NtrC family response regulator
MAEARVLIVDDEAEFLDSIGERLRNRGFQVDTALNGREALQKVQGNLYDAIVLDLMMPEMDGLQTMEKALEKKPELQVILLTGHATLEKGLEAMKGGALDFLEKPVDLDLLIQKIAEGKSRRVLLEDQLKDAAVKEALKKYGW